MFPNIKRTKFQFMNHMIYISQEFFIIDKIQSLYVQCTLEEINNQFPHNFLQNMMFNQMK
jgi:hypothetical protein